MQGDSTHVQQFYVEDESGTRRNGGRSSGSPISEVRWDDELAPATDLHSGHTLVPAGDYLPCSQQKTEGLIAITAAVELFPIGQPTSVVHDDVPVRSGFGPGSLSHILISQAGGRFREGGRVHLERGAEPNGFAVRILVSRAAAGEQTSRDEHSEPVQECLR